MANNKKIKECCTIGIVTYGRLNYTKQCIEAIWNTAGQYPFKIVVVNNYHPTENDDSASWLKEQLAAGRIHDLCLMTKNVGVAKAANAAWTRHPENKYFIKLDNDMIAKKTGWLDELVAVFESNPKGIGSIGYNVEPTSYDINAEVGNHKLRIKQGNIGGACLFTSKAVEDVVGNFIEIFETYGEEDAHFHLQLYSAGKWNAYMEDEDAFFHLPAGKAAIIDTTSGNFEAKDGLEELNEKDYRAFKDSFRTKNVPKLMNIIQGLREGRKLSKVVSNAAKDFKWKWHKI